MWKHLPSQCYKKLEDVAHVTMADRFHMSAYGTAKRAILLMCKVHLA